MALPQRQSVSSYTDITSYDSFFSSVQYRLLNMGGLIVVSPIVPEMIGRTPKKGDTVYDYDNQQNIFIGAENALIMRKALARFTEDYANSLQDEDYPKPGVLSLDLGNVKFKLHAPNNLKRGLKNHGKETNTEDKYILVIDREVDDEQIRMVHVFEEPKTYTIEYEGYEPEEVVIYSGIELLIKFLDGIINVGTGWARQAAAQAIPPAGGSDRGSNTKRAKRSFSGVAFDDEEVNEIEEDDEEETPRRPARRSPAASKAKKKSAVSLEEELAADFDEDVPQ